MPSILIADNNPYTLRVGRQVLLEEGHEVWLVSNSDEALGQILERRPELAMIGTMGEVSGSALCRLIKADSNLDQTQIILLAGPREKPPDSSQEISPPDGVLQKPLNPHSVIKMVRALLRQKSTTSGQISSDDKILDRSPQYRNDLSIFGSLTENIPSSILKDHSKQDTVIANIQPPQPENDLTDQHSTAHGDPLDTLVRRMPRNIFDTNQSDLRVAVTNAVESAMPAIIDQIVEQILKNKPKN